MISSGTAALSVALVLFAAFFANVALGAFARVAFLSDVNEMLMMFAAAIAFVVGVLQRELRTKRKAE